MANKEKRKYSIIFWLPIMILLLTLPLFTKFNSTERVITWQDFEKNIFNRNAVEKIIVRNNEFAEVYIKKELKNDDYFKEVLKPGFGNGIKNGPHYIFSVASADMFTKKID